MSKPKIIFKKIYTYVCPICDEEYYEAQYAQECLDKCYKYQLEEEKILKEKEALAPLKGQIDFFGMVI